MSRGFTHLIVTAPTERIALVYSQLLEDLKAGDASCARHLQGTSLHCVADPTGVRIGSGGGTLNALDHLEGRIGRTGMLAARVLVIHSGGDSRRAPLHSVCGKAWASVNCGLGEGLSEGLSDNADASDGYGAGLAVSSPMALLVAELSSFCFEVCRVGGEGEGEEVGGYVVVASSDVLLDICPSGGGGQSAPLSLPRHAVCVVGVPERPDVAKNHGVLIPTPTPTPLAHAHALARPCRHYLQKPSLPQMLAHGALNLPLSNPTPCPTPGPTPGPKPSTPVYVDTGVVIATGRAYSALLALLDQVRICTTTCTCDASMCLYVYIYIYKRCIYVSIHINAVWLGLGSGLGFFYMLYALRCIELSTDLMLDRYRYTHNDRVLTAPFIL